jgi:hypothetical protein
MELKYAWLQWKIEGYGFDGYGMRIFLRDGVIGKTGNSHRCL